MKLNKLNLHEVYRHENDQPTHAINIELEVAFKNSIEATEFNAKFNSSHLKHKELE